MSKFTAHARHRIGRRGPEVAHAIAERKLERAVRQNRLEYAPGATVLAEREGRMAQALADDVSPSVQGWGYPRGPRP